jgi:hypothetical protein
MDTPRKKPRVRKAIQGLDKPKPAEGLEPSHEQIAAACQRIQEGWSDREMMTRLRFDCRPVIQCADGRPEPITAEIYSISGLFVKPDGGDQR